MTFKIEQCQQVFKSSIKQEHITTQHLQCQNAQQRVRHTFKTLTLFSKIKLNMKLVMLLVCGLLAMTSAGKLMDENTRRAVRAMLENNRAHGSQVTSIVEIHNRKEPNFSCIQYLLCKVQDVMCYLFLYIYIWVFSKTGSKRMGRTGLDVIPVV